MLNQAEDAPTLTEVALVAGTPRSVARTALSAGILSEDDMSWVDALALRVFFTTSSVRFPGETGRRTREIASARAALAASTVRAEVDAGRMLVGVALVVTRDSIKVAPTIGHVVVYLDQDLAGLEPAQVLPVGRWWYEMRWREGGSVPPSGAVGATSR